MSLDGCVRRSDEFTFICSSLLCVCMTKLRTMAKLWAWWEGKTVSLFGSLDACVNHILCFASTLVRLSDFECRKSCFLGDVKVLTEKKNCQLFKSIITLRFIIFTRNLRCNHAFYTWGDSQSNSRN